MNIRVFNADDHPILLKGIVDLIVSTEGLDWVGSARDGKETLEKIIHLEPDIALLDIEMPHYSGIEVARKLREEKVSTKIILFTLFKDSSFIKQALDEGVMGYLLKESTELEIIDCIRKVAGGTKYVTAALADTLINLNNPTSSILTVLTEHELAILKLIARNKTSKEIASMMFLSPKTISNHRSNISKKLQLGGEQNALLKWVLENKHLLN